MRSLRRCAAPARLEPAGRATGARSLKGRGTRVEGGRGLMRPRPPIHTSPIVAPAPATAVPTAGVIVPRGGVVYAEVVATHVAVCVLVPTGVLALRRRDRALSAIEEVVGELLARNDARAGCQAARETPRDARADAAAAGTVASAAWARVATRAVAAGSARGSGARGVLSVGSPPKQHPEHPHHEGENDNGAPRKVRRRCGAGQERPFAGAVNESELGLELRHRPRIFFAQTGIELLGTRQLGAGQPGVTLAGIELRLHIVSLRAGRMITQHLVHQLLRLIEMARSGGVVDLSDRGIRVRSQRRRAGEGKGESRSRQGTRKQCSHNHPSVAEYGRMRS